MPDVAAEIKSPDNTYKALRDKATYYINNGTRMVLLIYPEKQLVEIYHANADIEILQLGDTIHGGNVLPGFELDVAYLFK